MRYNTTKGKIKKLFLKSNQEKVDIINKANEKEKILLNNKQFKYLTTLYDSDWQTALAMDGNIAPADDNPNASILVSEPLGDGTTEQEDIYPVRVNYSFTQEMQIAEEDLPFVKVRFLTKSYPELTYTTPLVDLTIHPLSETPYYRLKGDSTVLYQGYYPPRNNYIYSNRFHEDDIIAGLSTLSITSKLFEGTLRYTQSGDNYKIENAFIHRILTYYNVSLAGNGQYNYETFDVLAIDSLSSTSMTGKGIYTKYEWVESPPSVWTLVTTTTLNITKTVPLREDTTDIYLWGDRYINDISDGTGTFHVTFPGTFGGSASLQVWDFDYENYRRIFYSSNKARLLNINSSTYLYLDLPTKSIYQSGTLPYSELTFEVNPTPPEAVEDTISTGLHNQNIFWVKLYDSEPVPTFRLYFSGYFYYSTLASEEVDQEYDFVDEEYTEVGNTYQRVAENRPTKTETVYYPRQEPIQCRVLVALQNPRSFYENKIINEQKI